ncbi:hypothetical protein GCM10023088_22880 [Actinomadura verrucosospora]
MPAQGWLTYGGEWVGLQPVHVQRRGHNIRAVSRPVAVGGCCPSGCAVRIAVLALATASTVRRGRAPRGTTELLGPRFDELARNYRVAVVVVAALLWTNTRSTGQARRAGPSAGLIFPAARITAGEKIICGHSSPEARIRRGRFQRPVSTEERAADLRAEIATSLDVFMTAS